MARFDISGSVSRQPFQPKALEDQMRDNQISKNLVTENPALAIAPKPQLEQVSPPSLLDAAKQTVNWEGRRDSSGNLAVYNLPSGDMGGSYEVAGINDKFHPQAAATLRNMSPADREDFAAKYIEDYTSPLTSKLPEAYRPFFQDLAFNRGLAGATKFLQRAIGVKDDGLLGPKTLSVLEQQNPRDVLRKTSLEQLNYERRLAEENPARKKFLNGLEARIRNRLTLFGQV